MRILCTLAYRMAAALICTERGVRMKLSDWFGN